MNSAGPFGSLMRCHPFEEIEVTRAEGVHLWDRLGRCYLDFESGIWCVALGHNHPAVTAAVRSQIESVAHLAPRLTGYCASRAAEKLVAVVREAAAGGVEGAPGPAAGADPPSGGGGCRLSEGRVVFLSSGSEAVDFAIRVARALTGRRRVATLASSFVGAVGEAAEVSTAAGTSVTAAGARGVRAAPHAVGNSERDVTIVAWQGSTPVPTSQLDDVSCLLVEPVLASAGVRIPPPAVTCEAARAVGAGGGLVVVDEVTTGLGRVGKWFGYLHHGLDPDIVVVGKALGNGFPVSAVIVSREVEEGLAALGFRHVQSHQNDPFGCAVAAAVLDEMRRLDLPEASRRLGAYVAPTLRALWEEFPEAISDVRGLGLLWAIELADGVDAEAVWRRVLRSGVLLGVRPDLRILRLAPPLVATRSDVDEACERLRECFLSHREQSAPPYRC